MISLTQTLTQRAQESSVPLNLLKTVYLREARESGPALRERALRRVDGFILYACLRDTSYPLDRDLVTYLS